MSNEKYRERNRDGNTSGSNNGEGNVTRHNTLRERGQALLNVGDAAIKAALSRDSEAFLSQNRQTGGQ